LSDLRLRFWQALERICNTSVDAVPMTKLNVTVDRQKCQAYGACLKTAPEVFRLSADNKAEVLDPAAAPEEVVLKSARGCPYRAITVIDAQTGAQLHPRMRT
jgi:ferredoxin